MVSVIALLLTSTASANPHNAVSVLVGASTTFDGDPASARVSVRGDLGIVHSDVAGLSVLVPVTFATTGESGFGFSSRQSAVEIPVGVRGTLLPHDPIRPYADLGVGPAIGTSQFSGWLLDGSSTNVAFMTRAALGLELGPNDGLSFVIEPASWRTYYSGDASVGEYGVNLGFVAPL